MYNVKVDKDTCISCETCVAICEKAFKMGKDGKAEPTENETDCDCVVEARDSCPVGAISIDKINK